MAYLISRQGLHGPVVALVNTKDEAMVLREEDRAVVADSFAHTLEDDEIPGPRLLEAVDMFKRWKGAIDELYTPRSPIWGDNPGDAWSD